MKQDTAPVIAMIKDEMVITTILSLIKFFHSCGVQMKRYGFTWKIRVGFHAESSLEHLHLHIFSSDLISDHMKTKRHYNGLHPTLGFFLHLEDVLYWCQDLSDEAYAEVRFRLFTTSMY